MQLQITFQKQPSFALLTKQRAKVLFSFMFYLQNIRGRATDSLGTNIVEGAD